MKLNHWRFIVIGCALASAALYGALLNSPPSFALGRQAPALQAGDNEVCPLSETQEKESIKAFDATMPIFTHPRCINCHGAVNPFVADGGHIGGRIKLKMETATEVDADTGKETQVVKPAEDQNTQCQDCHSLLKGWRIAPPSLSFVGKDAPALCQQMKFELGSAQTFVAHLEHDNGDFINESFKGTRGLNDANGQATYENETGKDYKLEPPPISHAQFVDLGRAWIEAMGGKFKGGDMCGCKPHRYALKITTDLGAVFNESFLKGRADSHSEFKIPITFNDDGSFRGQTSVDRTIAGTVVIGRDNEPRARDISCKVSATVKGELWKVEATQPSQWFKVTLSNAWPNPMQSTAQCNKGSGTISIPQTSPAGSFSFDLPNFLDGTPNGMPDALDVSNPPYGFGKIQVQWVDESAP